jgi:hypothetical protein
MTKRSGFSVSSAFFLQLSLGLFFLMLGIMGLESRHSFGANMGRFFGKDDSLQLVMSIVEICVGAILLLGLFVSVSSALSGLVTLAIFVLWAAFIVLVYFVDGLGKPGWIVWLYEVSWHCVILVALWMVGRQYMA